MGYLQTLCQNTVYISQTVRKLIHVYIYKFDVQNNNKTLISAQIIINETRRSA